MTPRVGTDGSSGKTPDARFSSPATANPSTLRVDSVRLPLQFILTGIAALVCGITALIVRPELLAGYHYNQYAIAITHVFTLGWIMSVMIGAMYQLVPVALETRLHSTGAAHCHFWLHVIGWPGMVLGFWTWKIPYVIVFGALVGGGILVFVYNLGRTLRRIPKLNVVSCGVACSLAWLTATMLAGLFAAGGKLWTFTALDPIAQMHAHAHLGGVGFFVMMLVAVSYKLVPMFALSEVQSQRRAWLSILLLNIGLLGAAVTIAVSSPWKLAFTLVIIAGVAVYGDELASILRARKRRRLDIPLMQFLGGVALLAPTCLCALVLAWPQLPATLFSTQLENAYGWLAILGVITLAIIGMLYKIVPFLVWYATYSKHIGRCKVPALADLASAKLQVAGLATFGLGFTGAGAATLLASENGVRWSSIVLLASVVLFVCNILRILLHLARPRLPSLAASQARTRFGTSGVQGAV